MKMKKGMIIGIAAVVLIAIVALTCTATVQTGYTGIVTTFGRVEDVTLEAGLHFKSPFQRIISMDNREQKSSFTTEAFSSDIQQVDITGSINYAINKSTAMNLFKEVGTDYFNKLIYPRMLEITKGVFSKYTAENLVANRQRLSEAIREGLHEELNEYGINVISVSIENLDFTDAFTDAGRPEETAGGDRAGPDDHGNPAAGGAETHQRRSGSQRGADQCGRGRLRAAGAQRGGGGSEQEDRRVPD